MKYLFILFFVTLATTAQVSNESLNLMPWPQKIELKSGNFALNSSFKVNVTGQPNSRIFVATSNFLRRLDGRTGLFFKQGFVTSTNEYPNA
jgi:hexosaminidase